MNRQPVFRRGMTQLDGAAGSNACAVRTGKRLQALGSQACLKCQNRLSFGVGPPEGSRLWGFLFEEWTGAESNRRHQDFQSCALPTELPVLDASGVRGPGGGRISFDAGRRTSDARRVSRVGIIGHAEKRFN